MSDTIVRPAAHRRLASIDALRGFDMLVIMGLDRLVRSLAPFVKAGDDTRLGALLRGLESLSDRFIEATRLDQWGVRGFRTESLIAQFEHVEWEGFRFYDLIFPLFLFVVGVVLPFSLGKYAEGTEGRRQASYRALARFVSLMFIALAYAGLFKLDFSNFRWPGVLQRIAICYLIAAWAVILLPRWGQLVFGIAAVAIYSGLLLQYPVPGFGKGDFSMEGNVSTYVDQRVLVEMLHSEMCCYKHGDNEGIVSTLGAIGTTMLGVMAGHWLRGRANDALKTFALIAAGALAVWGGLAASDTIPIIKNIWTPTFVLYAGGWSLILLGAFYGVIDGLGWRRWAFFFVVIGANAITIYVAPRIIDFDYAAKFFFGGLMRLTAVEPYGRLIGISGMLAMKWLFLYFLYRNRIFLRA